MPGLELIRMPFLLVDLVGNLRTEFASMQTDPI